MKKRHFLFLLVVSLFVFAPPALADGTKTIILDVNHTLKVFCTDGPTAAQTHHGITRIWCEQAEVEASPLNMGVETNVKRIVITSGVALEVSCLREYWSAAKTQNGVTQVWCEKGGVELAAIDRMSWENVAASINVTWDGFVELAAALVAVIAAGGGVAALVDWLKQRLRLEGNIVMALSWIIGGIVALLGAIVAGLITPELASDPFRLLAVIISVLFSAEKQYRFRRDQRLKRASSTAPAR